MEPTANPPDALPRRLNLREFAQRARSLEGSVGLAELPRLLSSLHAAGVDAGALRVHWSVQGMLRERADGGADPLVRLRVQAALPLTCQRCLQACTQPIDDVAVLRLVDEEPEIDPDELESEEEAFCARHPVDLLELIEDQLILALPLVPMHDSCPQPLPVPHQADTPLEAPASPFAVLAGLRNKPGGGVQ